MGYRTLSLDLILRALFLDDRAFDQMRDDDNPFVEGLFLIVAIATITGLLAFIGQLLGWAATPRLGDMQQVILGLLREQPWWEQMAASPQALAQFQQFWDGGWRLFPALAGAPDPRAAAFNIIAWPLWGIISWLTYGVVAYLFARLFGGVGTLSKTLGTTALAFTPWMFHGLQVIPFFVLGGAISTWQLILRYKAIRSAHDLTWARAMWATLLPFLLLVALSVLAGGVFATLLALTLGGR